MRLFDLGYVHRNDESDEPLGLTVCEKSTRMVTFWLHFELPENDEAVIACKITACVGSKTGTTGLEPATYGLTSHRSNQLSYAPKEQPAPALAKVGSGWKVESGKYEGKLRTSSRK